MTDYSFPDSFFDTVLCPYDLSRLERVLNASEEYIVSADAATFLRAVMEPMQTACDRRVTLGEGLFGTISTPWCKGSVLSPGLVLFLS